MLETSDLYPDVKLYKPQLVAKNPYNNIGELSYKPEWFAQEKIDGYWECLVKENNQVYMFARSKSKTQGWYTEKSGHVPHLKYWAMENLPNGTMLIGEIYVPDGTSKDVTTILGCKEEKAIQRQKDKGLLCYYIHDILKYDGKDYVQEELTNDERVSLLYEKIDIGTDLIPQTIIATYKDGIYMDFEQVFERTLSRGGEGLVFKKKNGLYLPGKRRADNMFKVKQDQGDMDFIVTGFVEPVKEYVGTEELTWPYWIDIEGKPTHSPWTLDGAREKRVAVPVTKAYYFGWKMGVTLGLYDGDKIVECGKCTSGFTDADREDMAKNPNKYLNKCITVGAMSVDKKEYSLRHPRFEKWHFEKPVEDCTIESVFG